MSSSAGRFLGAPVTALLILLVGAAVFSNTLHNHLYMDDEVRVLANPGIQSVFPVSRHFTDPHTISTQKELIQFRPLLPLSLSLNFAAAGESLPGFHLANIALQLLTALTVFCLCRELTAHWTRAALSDAESRGISLAIGLLFAIHPVSGILVNYICARDLILMELFMLPALLVYIRMRRRGTTVGGWAAVLALTVLSILGKTNTVVLPALTLGFELVVAGESPRRSGPWLRTLPFGITIAAFFAYTRFYLHFSDLSAVVGLRYTPWTYFLTQLDVHLSHYFVNMLRPWHIRMFPYDALAESPLDPRVLAGALAIGLTLALAWVNRRSEPLISYGILSYWVLMAPESSVVPFHLLAVDYRPYAALPFAFLAAALLLHHCGRGRLVGAVFTTYICCMAWMSYQLNETWSTSEAVWTHSVELGGDHNAQMNLAQAIGNLRDPRTRVLLEEALRQGPEYVLPHLNLGLMLVYTRQDVKRGLGEIDEAIRINPETSISRAELGRVYQFLGQPELAAKAAEAAADRDPGNLQYQYDAAAADQRVSKHLMVIGWTDRILAARPDFRDTLFVRGVSLEALGRNTDAIDAYQRFLQLSPDQALAQFNLGCLLENEEKFADAIPHLEKALQLDRTQTGAHMHLAACYEKTGQADLAARHRKLFEEE